MSFFRGRMTVGKMSSHLRRRKRFFGRPGSFNRGWVRASRQITRSRRFDGTHR